MAATVILAFQECREWLKDSRKYKILAKAYQLVRGTEYEELVNQKTVDLWITAWWMEQDRRDRSILRVLEILDFRERPYDFEEARIVREIRTLRTELLRDDALNHGQRFVELWGSINQRYDQIYELEQARKRVAEADV